MGRALTKLPIQPDHPLCNGVSGEKFVSRCPVCITAQTLFSVWALAVSQSLRLGSWLVAFVEERDGRGVQLQYVRVLTRRLQFILLTPDTETGARPRITGF